MSDADTGPSGLLVGRGGSEPEIVPEAPTWPKPIGITSIVWGSVGVTCAGCGVANVLLSPYLMKMAEDQMGPAPDVLKPPMSLNVLNAVGLFWAVLLIVAGVLTVRRSRAGRWTHLIYALGGLLLTAVVAWLNLAWQGRIAEWVQQNPGDKWAAYQNQTFALILLGFGVILGAAWPVFCLLWFGAMGRDPASAGASSRPRSPLD